MFHKICGVHFEFCHFDKTFGLGRLEGFEKQEQKGHLKGTIQDFLLERWVQIDACQRPLWSVIDPIVFMAQHQ